MKNESETKHIVHENNRGFEFPGADEAELEFPLDRRQFLKLTGGGILVAFSIPGALALQERPGRRGGGQELPADFNAFLRIGEDGRVTGFTGKVELGQGAITALAKIEGNKMTIWASTQTPFPLKDAAASLLGLPPENVRVITPFVGGGFGGKSNIRQALEAVRLAKLTGKPVQVAWTRAEEFFYDTFRPAAVVKIKAGLAASGLISFWDYGVYFAGERGSQQFYNIPHHRTVAYGSGWTAPEGAHPFATGPWRAPGNNTNTFARESHSVPLLSREINPHSRVRLTN